MREILLAGVAAIGIAALGLVAPASLQAQPAVAIDNDDIGGVVTGPKGPEAGVWVIAETRDLPVRFIRIVVTDDNGTPGTPGDDFTLTCPKTTLAAGESMTCSKTITVTDNRTNIAVVNAISVGGTPVTDNDDAVVRVPSINIDKTADDHLVEPNQVVSFTLNVKVVNGPVSNAVVTDTLPVGQTFVVGSAAPSQPTVSVDGRTLTWNLGTLNNGDPAVTITYDVTIDAGATIDPQNNVAKLCVSELPLCDQDDETVTPEKPEILIVKTAGDAADGEVFSTEAGNVTYTYVVTNTGPLPLQNVTVRDDNGTPATGDDFAVTCPKTTLAVDESMTCTATILVIFNKTNIATAHGVTAEGNPVEDTDNAVVEILVHGLVIAKSNDAPIEHLELPDGTFADLPTAKEGSTVTFILHYTFSGAPVTHGVITDVLPVGLTYVAGSATNSGEFIFAAYNPTTRTLTWNAATVSASGTVTYKAKVDKGAAALDQPLTNVATIDSDQTEPSSDTSDVFVPVPPLAETHVPTAPPTDTVAQTEGQSGSSLPLILAILGVILLAVAFVTPVPAPVRRRNRR
jgi:fimbrial isopeptide formation D2 family protein